jgi:hypothetical protein
VLDHVASPRVLPPDHRQRRPWSRDQWLALADSMLMAVRPYASPGHARITLPGPEGGYGRAVDGLEGFARTLLLAGFRIAGERGAGLDELIDWYARGIATGTDPTSPERWVRLDEHGQAKVEAASIALILDLTRPYLWDRLSPIAQERVVEYLAPAVGDDTYPHINWVWFRLVVQTFLRSVGGPHSVDEMKADLDTHDGFVRSDGWLSDGATRAYDHYVGWALHLYPTLWARMSGAGDLAAGRRERDAAMLDRFLTDAIALIGADGSPLIQGRSLIYRFAAAAPFWVGALAGVPSVSAGQLRRATTGIVDHFVTHGAFDARGLLTMGWHAPWRALAQSYSGPGSPYWAAKGMLGIALPADHPVWTVEELALPSEVGGVTRAMRAPGWIATSTPEDGIVRVVNHGTDHSVEGSKVGDSPLYARLGYSTATSPVLDENGWAEPVDQSVTLVHPGGRASHRSGMRTVAVYVEGEGPFARGVAGSTTEAHWVEPDRDAFDYGEGRPGRATAAGRLTVYSIVRGPWEVRLSRVDGIAEGVDPASVRLRIAGWALAGPTQPTFEPTAVTLRGSGLCSRLVALSGPTVTPGVADYEDASPLGRGVRVPWLEYPVEVGSWVCVLVELRGGPAPAPERPPIAAVEADEGRSNVRVLWPDGADTSTQISESEVASPAAP